MHDADRLLSDAAALVQADHDADLRSEAHEVFLAEAARCRLADRHGRGQVLLRCGVRLEGEWCPQERITGCVTLLGSDGRQQLAAERAVVLVSGTRAALRVEATGREATLGQWLREAWDDGDILRALDASGGWNTGPVSFVGADHVVIETDSGAVVLPTSTVEAWSR